MLPQCPMCAQCKSPGDPPQICPVNPCRIPANPCFAFTPPPSIPHVTPKFVEEGKIQGRDGQ